MCMKKAGLLLICFILTILPCSAKSSETDIEKADTPKIFVYHIPDDNTTGGEISDAVSEKKSIHISDIAKTIKEEAKPVDITSDDITADTSPDTVAEANDDEYEIDDMYSDVLKGYAVYDEEEEDAISLDTCDEDCQKLNISLPSKIEAFKFVGNNSITSSQYKKYSKYNNPEYNIAPLSSKNYRSKGGFTAGTIFDQSIDYAELEQSTGVFSRYESKHFAISSAYMKTVNSTNNNYNDNFYFSPELKLNQYFTLKEILSADITRNRKKAEFVVSINPFGKKDEDRLRFELGTSSTFDETNTVIKNQFKFSTRIKL